MNSTARKAAGAVALAVALGAGTPVVTATAAHAKSAHVTTEHADKKGGQKAAQALRKVLQEVAKADKRLGHLARESRTSRLGEAEKAAVLANISSDRQALAELAAAVQSPESTVDLGELRDALKELRPQNYNQVVNDLRHAARLTADIAAARTALEGEAAAPVAELDAAQLLVDAAVAKALAITASSDRASLRAVKVDLAAAHASFDVVADYLENRAEEPVVEEELVVEEEPVEEPVVDPLP